MRQNWTNPKIENAPGGTAGYSHAGDAIDMIEVRREIQKLALWTPQLDERPTSTVTLQNDDMATEFSFAGAGVLRSIFIAGRAPSTQINVYVDGESSPRISMTMAELVCCMPADAKPFAHKWFGFSTTPNSTNGAGISPSTTDFGFYFNLPIPFRNGIRVDFGSGDGVYIIATASVGASIDYGRYNFLNGLGFNRTVARGATETLASAVNKRGAIFGLFHYLNGTAADEGDYVFNCDGTANGFEASSDIFLQSFYFQSFGHIGPDSRDLSPMQSEIAGIVYKTAGVDANVESGYRFFTPQMTFETSMAATWSAHDDATIGDLDAATSEGVLWYYTET